jgi:hypothetical protein
VEGGREGSSTTHNPTRTREQVNVLDKSKADWQQLKRTDAALEEELEAHRRSGGQYLDKVCACVGWRG